jgi:hypothetical protein
MFSWLSLKPQNHSDDFRRFDLKISGDGF